MAGVYDSLSRGIESGFNMGLRNDQAQEDRRARNFQEERQKKADARAEEEYGLNMRRRADEDFTRSMAGQTAPLEKRKGELETLSVAARTANQPLDPALAAEYGAVDKQLSSLRQRAMDYWSRVHGGRENPEQTPDGELYRNLAVAIGRRPEELPQVAQSIRDMKDAIETGNTGLAVQSANVLMAPQLQRGVGAPSPYGGKIVRKEIIGLDPARGGDDRDHPNMVIPRLRVYVQMDEGEGKQYYYDAPMSKGGGTDDAPAALDIARATEWMGATGTLAEVLQNPEVMERLRKGSEKAGAEVNRYLQQLTQLGDAKKPKPTIRAVGPGGLAEFDAQGNLIGMVEPPKKAPAASVQGLAARLAAVDALEGTSEADKEKLRAAVIAGGRGRVGGGTGGGAANLPAPNIPDATLYQMAERLLAGDKSVKVNLGRGVQGAANIIAIENKVTELALDRGLSGRDIALAMAEFGGLGAAQRALGTRAANFGLAKSEAYEMADLVTQSSELVSRTEFMPVNKALIAFEKNTGNVEVRQFGASINSFVNAYARAVSPIGTPTVSDKDHAREMLSTADSHKQVVGIITQLKKEMVAAGNAPGVVRRELRETFKTAPGAPPKDNAPSPAGGAPQPTPADVDWAKQNPQNRANFVKAFGREP